VQIAKNGVNGSPAGEALDVIECVDHARVTTASTATGLMAATVADHPEKLRVANPQKQKTRLEVLWSSILQAAWAIFSFALPLAHAVKMTLRLRRIEGRRIG